MSPLNDRAATQSGTNSRQPRQSRLVQASLNNDRLGRINVRVRNVSESGIGGICELTLQIGERITVHLPGHRSMKGIVRWSYRQRFGIETDSRIHIPQLRAAHGGHLPSTDSSVEFRIIPPVKGDFRRPAVKPRRD